MEEFSNGDIFAGEVIGTAILVLFGAGVCAAVNLRFSKARGAGWVVIAFGWGFGVLAGAYTALPLSGGHINPAVTIGVAAQSGEWGKVPLYIVSQLIGAFIGAVLAWAAYYSQFAANADPKAAQPTLGNFSTIPEVRNPVTNLITEIIGDQPRPRPRPPNSPLHAADTQQGHLRLELCLGAGGRSGHRRPGGSRHLFTRLLSRETRHEGRLRRSDRPGHHLEPLHHLRLRRRHCRRRPA